MKNKESIVDILENSINEYDKIYDDLIFGFPDHIWTKVVEKYQGKKAFSNYLSFFALFYLILKNKIKI